ncbi:MAG: MFS transporter [Treponema sp.]|nr:MFS transporter [Treponema sp.]
MAAALSPYRLAKARGLYNRYTTLNAISWQFLAGNIITLLALRMGANSTYVGMISAVLYVAFFFLPLGRLLARRFSIVKIFSIAWILRSISMLPVFFAPFVFASGDQYSALFLILLGVSLFHVIRGVGFISNNPILSYLSAGPDRGSYQTYIQIIASAVGMFSGFAIAMLLGRNPPLYLYAVIIAAGIIAGILSGIVMLKVPSPEMEDNAKQEKLSRTIREALSQPAMRNFFFILILVALASGVSRTFVVVYSREVFSQSDGMVSLYAVFGGMGGLIAGMVIKFLVDKIGAKPIFSLYVIIGLVSLLPVIFLPMSMFEQYPSILLFLIFLFFMMNFGWLGSEGVMQTYFMGMIPEEKMMDMGILYFLGFGIAGAGGLLLGGAFLDTVTTISGSMPLAFKILFAILVVVTIKILFLMHNLIPLGALPFKGALEVMFSIRELKAISLLDKLDKTSDSGEEAALLVELQGTPSLLATKKLLTRARSPRLSVRMESIRTIDAMQSLNADTEQALMDDIVNNPYTTAYMSARTLGNHGVFKAIPLLRELADSSDYMLAGEAIVALAKLHDDDFRTRVQEIVVETKNPRLKIMGAEALGVYGSPFSLAVLLEIKRQANPPPYLLDGIVLAMSNILDIQNKFYPLLIRVLADKSVAATLALDEAEAAYENYMSVIGRKRKHSSSPEAATLSRQAKSFQAAVSSFVKNNKGEALSRWIQELPDDLVHAIVQTILAETVISDEFMEYPSLQLLIVHWAAHELRLWTKKLKE